MSLKFHHLDTSRGHGEIDTLPFEISKRDGLFEVTIHGVPKAGVWTHRDQGASSEGLGAIRNSAYAALAKYRDWQRSLMPAQG